MNWVTSYGNLQMQYTGTVAMLAQFPTAAEGERRRKRKRRGQQGRQPTRQYEDRQHARASAAHAFITRADPESRTEAELFRERIAEVTVFPEAQYRVHAPWWLHSTVVFPKSIRQCSYVFLMISLRRAEGWEDGISAAPCWSILGRVEREISPRASVPLYWMQASSPEKTAEPSAELTASSAHWVK